MPKFVNKVSKAVKEAANVTSKKITEIANVTKYTVRLKSKEVELDEAFEKLGKLYYAQKTTNAENDEQINVCLESIEQIRVEMASLKKNIAIAGGKIECPSCKSLVPSDKSSCPKCKTSLERLEIIVVNDDEEK